MFKRKNACEHNYDYIGKYYKETLTEFSNDFDIIETYNRCICDKCGKLIDIVTSREEFLPSLYKGIDDRHNKYVKQLIEKGYVLEFELQL